MFGLGLSGCGARDARARVEPLLMDERARAEAHPQALGFTRLVTRDNGARVRFTKDTDARLPMCLDSVRSIGQAIKLLWVPLEV